MFDLTWHRPDRCRFSVLTFYYFLFLLGSKASESKHQDKPANVTVNSGSGNTVWAKVPSLFQLATIFLFIACLYPVYKHIATLEKALQEVQVKQNMKINTLEKDNNELKAKLKSVTEVSKNNRKLLDTTVGDLDKMNLFVKEFYKNYIFTYTLTDKHSSSIQFLHNFTAATNETLMKVIYELDERTTSINERFERTERCQSGTEVGEHTYPAQAFPLERTVKFDPPFKKVPAFSYGTMLLDSTSHLSVKLHLLSLTTESFKIKINTWGKKYALYGAKFSWMACPK